MTTGADKMSKKKTAGMYEIGNKDWPQITVGEFTIARQDEKGVWIETKGGEGGEFSDELFEQAIKEFYNKHF